MIKQPFCVKVLMRSWKLIFFLALALLFLWYLINVIGSMPEANRNCVDEKDELDFADLQKCELPQLVPWSPDALKFENASISPPMPICDRSKLRFKLTFENYLVRLNENDVFWNTSVCFYKPVTRDLSRPDFKYFYVTSKYPIQSNSMKLDPDLEHIYVWCKSKVRIPKSKEVIYEDYLSAVQLKPELEEKLSKDSNKDFYSIMIIGQDSVSHMGFRRFMPKAHEYLVKKMDAIEFNGFNSLGPGTLWSVFPLFTGLDFIEYQNQCWPDQTGYHDDCPHIWKDFRAKGYRTAYDEDSLHMGNFNQKQGFKTNQFSYDFRTVSNLLMGGQAGHYVHNYCYGSRLSFEVLLENMCRMATTFHDKPFWSYMWAQSLSHSDVKEIRHGEESMLESLKYLNEKQLLNRTIVIVISDHGSRYGPFRRKTRQGYLEERLPLLYIVLPKHFRDRFPLATQNVQQNANKLTSAFDVYETMKDLMNLDDLSPKRLEERRSEESFSVRRNVSLFLPINPDRTCGMLNLSFTYCSCQYRDPIPTNTSMVRKLSAFALKSINDKLSKFSQCSQLYLVNVTQAHNLKVQGSFKDDYDRFGSCSFLRRQLIQIVIETKPGRGVFEVTVLTEGLKALRVEEANRVTAYANDSACVKEKKLRPFCFCKS